MRALLLSFAVLAAASSAYAAPQTWLLAVDRWGNAEHRALTLETAGKTLSGLLDGWPVTGRDEGDRLTFEAIDSRGAPYRFEATVRGDRALAATALQASSSERCPSTPLQALTYFGRRKIRPSTHLTPVMMSQILVQKAAKNAKESNRAARAAPPNQYRIISLPYNLL
jgi:hypothetical protein